MQNFTFVSRWHIFRIWEKEIKHPQHSTEPYASGAFMVFSSMIISLEPNASRYQGSTGSWN
jgi:hypothetical protein